MQSIALVVAYDGTNYCGWQSQTNGLSVQEAIEKACKEKFKHKVTVRGCSRTDAGVHAEHQVVAIQVDTDILVEKIPFVLNSSLPDDIVVKSAKYVLLDFHPIRDAKYKIYRYSILNTDIRVPKMMRYVAYYYKALDIRLMRQAAKFMIGTHDFKAFCSSEKATKTTVRTIYDIQIKREKNNIINIYVKGNGFLHHMVRIIAGTLIRVGEKTIDKNEIKNIIDSLERKNAGPTAVAGGLTLEYVSYDDIVHS
ncbi:MAG: tRNA pseudouridine(38-40) synthase TruA [Clostridiales bacterium GWD2_32_59]|nr:MAG: tRNA pseudouridine(38-40) synthase TruA [Clostridiales bacterium GWD2_32_59]